MLEARSSGRFWLPTEDQRNIGGWLDLGTQWPLLNLAEALTPSMKELSRLRLEDGSEIIESGPADDDVDPETFTVHGILRQGPRRVTLVGATSVGRDRLLGWLDPGAQRLRADYALIGGFESGEDAVFTAARLHLRHLDAWAQLPGVAISFPHDGSSMSATYEAQEPEVEEVPALAGRLVLDATVSPSDPTVRGVGFERTAYLRLEVAQGLTVDALWRKFVVPLRVLLTLALDSDSPATTLEVCNSEGRWLEVVRPELAGPSSELLPAYDVLLSRQQLSLRHLAKWLEVAPTLTPIPELVAGVSVTPDRTLANLLLELATAVEGLDRRLRDKHRVMTPGDAMRARRAARGAVDPEVQVRVNEALAHLEQPTYLERLKWIVAEGREAAPGVTGDEELWMRQIKEVRNGFAHQFGTQGKQEDQWRQYLVLLRTLRWLLIGVLLKQSGLDSAHLAQRLKQHQPFIYLIRQAHHWLPAVYRSEPSAG